MLIFFNFVIYICSVKCWRMIYVNVLMYNQSYSWSSPEQEIDMIKKNTHNITVAYWASVILAGWDGCAVDNTTLLSPPQPGVLLQKIQEYLLPNYHALKLLVYSCIFHTPHTFATWLFDNYFDTPGNKVMLLIESLTFTLSQNKLLKQC